MESASRLSVKPPTSHFLRKDDVMPIAGVGVAPDPTDNVPEDPLRSDECSVTSSGVMTLALCVAGGISSR